MTTEPSQPKREHKFSFGLWTVGNPRRDPFGEPVRAILPPRLNPHPQNLTRVSEVWKDEPPTDYEQRLYDDKTFERLEIRSSSITRGVMLRNSNMHKPCLTADTFNPIRVPRPELSI